MTNFDDVPNSMKVPRIQRRKYRLESDVKACVKKHLQETYCCVVSMPVQSGFGGMFLDLVVCIDGLYVELELKRAKGNKATERQVRRMIEISNAGGFSRTLYGCPEEEGNNFWEVMNQLDEWWEGRAFKR